MKSAKSAVTLGMRPAPGTMCGITCGKTFCSTCIWYARFGGLLIIFGCTGGAVFVAGLPAFIIGLPGVLLNVGFGSGFKIGFFAATTTFLAGTFATFLGATFFAAGFLAFATIFFFAGF